MRLLNLIPPGGRGVVNYGPIGASGLILNRRALPDRAPLRSLVPLTGRTSGRKARGSKVLPEILFSCRDQKFK
jgi:hypothetical protein